MMNDEFKAIKGDVELWNLEKDGSHGMEYAPGNMPVDSMFKRAKITTKRLR